MAAASTVPGLALGPSTSSKPVAALTHGSLSLATTYKEHKALKTLQQHQTCMRMRAVNKSSRNLRLPMVMSSMSNLNINFSPHSSSDTIKQFYTCINEKNLKQLSKFFSDDCVLEDSSFPQPFQGKKEVMQFFKQLIACMGQNLEFNIGHVWEGDDLTAGVTWHLEWKKKQLPFTRGCSFYECAKGEARLVIKKAHSVTESPIKPGRLVLVILRVFIILEHHEMLILVVSLTSTFIQILISLPFFSWPSGIFIFQTLLKTMTSLFDAFPQAAEWFLKSPNVMLQWFLKIYKIVLEPSIVALLGYYINIWNFVAHILNYTFKILMHISNIFFQ
ncbi:uncharacterized protein LOC132284788 isoform X1 [Cornus florida]|uniref:uncharacterized protein LOC132284788 isoform X1 n=1 Tax=Cornus florida TaxID=4283 RepID=UPI00289785A3|nr:uncharacterized protein LOC132284788 isoform X1 [Cornus florida]